MRVYRPDSGAGLARFLIGGEQKRRAAREQVPVVAQPQLFDRAAVGEAVRVERPVRHDHQRLVEFLRQTGGHDRVVTIQQVDKQEIGGLAEFPDIGQDCRET